MDTKQVMALRGGADVTLNIGLGARSVLGGRLSVAHKLRYTTKALPEIMMPGYMGYMSLTPHRVWVGEPLLIIQGRFRPGVNKTDQLWKLVESIEQDCIALYYHENDTGFLFGPDAANWGEFNINFFNFIGDSDV